MAYYIFLKSLRSLEEFRKNPHVKIPPKSPSTNFQSLAIIKNHFFIRKRIFFTFGPAAAHSSFFVPAAPPPLPTGPRPHGRPSRPARRWHPAESSPPPQVDASSRAAFALYSRPTDRWTPPVIPHLLPARARSRHHHLLPLPAPPSPTSDAARAFTTPPSFPPPQSPPPLNLAPAFNGVNTINAAVTPPATLSGAPSRPL
jgi:hypothetical protein